MRGRVVRFRATATAANGNTGANVWETNERVRPKIATASLITRRVMKGVKKSVGRCRSLRSWGARASILLRRFSSTKPDSRSRAELSALKSFCILSSSRSSESRKRGIRSETTAAIAATPPRAARGPSGRSAGGCWRAWTNAINTKVPIATFRVSQSTRWTNIIGLINSLKSGESVTMPIPAATRIGTRPPASCCRSRSASLLVA